MNKSAFLLIAILLLQSCVSSSGSMASKDDNRQFLTLMDHLRGQPGIQIRADNTVTVRGLQSLNGEQEPLYIIDGAQVGNSYQAANDRVDPNDVDSILVLRSVNSTSTYGMRGANGVILIKTKKSD